MIADSVAYAVTITAVRHDGEITIEGTSLLGEKTVATAVLDNIVVTFTVADLEAHELHFQPEAIADRMTGYGLTDEREAIVALVRELVFSWAPSVTPASDHPVDQFGGVDARISVAWARGVYAEALEALSPITERIAIALDPAAALVALELADRGDLNP